MRDRGEEKEEEEPLRETVVRQERAHTAVTKAGEEWGSHGRPRMITISVGERYSTRAECRAEARAAQCNTRRRKMVRFGRPGGWWQVATDKIETR
jgi:hypothetical protein